MAGRDLLASAQTGTGKTAAFVLPALQRLLIPAKGAGRGPRVLVLTPTRELAGQVESVIRELGTSTRLRSGTVVGGVSFAPQERLLRGSLDLLVATPGRLIDHMGQGHVDFSRVELFVLDEADRMLDMGFVKPVMRIAAALPAIRQTLLFSATMEGAVQEVSRRLLKNPAQIQLTSHKTRHEAITQGLHFAENPEHKHALLAHLLADRELTRAIVFTATKRGADRLAKRLNAAGHRCAPLHGNMSQNARNRTVDSLRTGRVDILVATDVAARGIDLIGVSHVINFDMPMVAEDYIHRIGRTGRNGATGTAISLVGPQDRGLLGSIERLTGQSLKRLTVQGIVRSLPLAPRAASAGPETAGRPRNLARRAPADPAVRVHRRPQPITVDGNSRRQAADADGNTRVLVSARPAPEERWNRSGPRRVTGNRQAARQPGNQGRR
jgi:superfamily II DNA/RNA helicase